MAENSKIEWTTHTFNPWVGCMKVSLACDNCYAEIWAKRAGTPELWGGERRRTTEGNWREPIKWNKRAAASGVRAKVFCASLADVFDNQVPEGWRADLFKLIDATPNLDWLLLTKRPQNIAKMMPPFFWDTGGADIEMARANVWLGTTCENQQEADRRIPHLLAIPAKVRFLSCEPLLGRLDLSDIAESDRRALGDSSVYRRIDALTGELGHGGPLGPTISGRTGPRIDWVIAGGESGPGARPMNLQWARDLRDQCAAAGVPYFFKQWGDWWPEPGIGYGEKLIVEPQNHHTWDEAPPYRYSFRRGKKSAGALLDGREWREMPR